MMPSSLVKRSRSSLSRVEQGTKNVGGGSRVGHGLAQKSGDFLEPHYVIAADPNV